MGGSAKQRRQKLVTREHILDGWRGSGLDPFDGFAKTIPAVPIARTPLQTIQAENLDFLAIHGANMTTPFKRRWSNMADLLSADRTHLTMLEAVAGTSRPLLI